MSNEDQFLNDCATRKISSVSLVDNDACVGQYIVFKAQGLSPGFTWFAGVRKTDKTAIFEFIGV